MGWSEKRDKGPSGPPLGKKIRVKGNPNKV